MYEIRLRAARSSYMRPPTARVPAFPNAILPPIRFLSSLHSFQVCGDTAVCRSGSISSGNHPIFKQKGYRRRFRAVQSRSEFHFSKSDCQTVQTDDRKIVNLSVDSRPEIVYNDLGISAHLQIPKRLPFFWVWRQECCSTPAPARRKEDNPRSPPVEGGALSAVPPL